MNSGLKGWLPQWTLKSSVKACTHTHIPMSAVFDGVHFSLKAKLTVILCNNWTLGCLPQGGSYVFVWHDTTCRGCGLQHWYHPTGPGRESILSYCHVVMFHIPYCHNLILPFHHTTVFHTWRPGQKASKESMKLRTILLGEDMLTSTNRGPFEIYFFMAA